MNLSPDFIRTIYNTFGARGEAWLAALPNLLADVARRWQLTLHPHFENLSYSYVAPVTCANGTSAVLKISVPNQELTIAIAALQFFNGDDVVRLLQADTDKGVMLLEKLSPGLMLTTVQDDEQATRIASEVMIKLWKPASKNLSISYRCGLGSWTEEDPLVVPGRQPPTAGMDRPRGKIVC
jgi:streptomycin 6-kinase